MISKRKRNTILAYCMASVIMLVAFISNVSDVTTQLTNSKKIVADNNYVETEDTSYGFVAIKVSSSIEKNDTKVVTEDKEEVKESKKTSDNKKSSSKATNTTKTTSTKKTTTTKTTTKKTTTKTTTKSTSTTPNPKVSNVELGKQIVAYAKQFVGNPYRMGGTSLTNGADCSGYTQSVYKHFGISLPRTAASQASVGVKVPFNALQPGDLVFYSNGGSKITHVAIYMGGGKIVHARTPSSGIGINSVNIMTKITARRVVK